MIWVFIVVGLFGSVDCEKRIVNLLFLGEYIYVRFNTNFVVCRSINKSLFLALDFRL